jgi:hypothetical protein
MTLLPASVVVSLFVCRLPFDLSSNGGPTSSYATAGIALRVNGEIYGISRLRVQVKTLVFIKFWSELVIQYLTNYFSHTKFSREIQLQENTKLKMMSNIFNRNLNEIKSNLTSCVKNGISLQNFGLPTRCG